MTQALERGQLNKQGRMEEEANQLYRRPQMTGQARYEEEEGIPPIGQFLEKIVMIISMQV